MFLFSCLFYYFFVTHIFKTMNKRKEPVHLREKPLSSGRTSLYLEINKDGMRRYEFLKLYLSNGKSKADKQEDKRIWELAEAIRAKRIVELRNNQYGFTDHENGKADLLMYVRMMGNKRTDDSSRRYFERLERLLVKYSGLSRIPFNSLEKNFLEGFLLFMQRYRSTKIGQYDRKESKGLAENTQYKYFTILKTVINSAVRSGIIPRNPFDVVDNSLKPKQEESKREFLTVEELGKLLATNPKDHTRKTFLFGCFTGLRHSDIITLKWEDIIEGEEGLTIRKKQQKTDNFVEIPMNKAAVSLLPKRKESGLIFGDKFTQVHRNHIIRDWVRNVGINKHITFHCSRHTFATLLISKGADLYVVSKLLGHTNIETTQIYAKVVDESKKKAVDLLPDFGND